MNRKPAAGSGLRRIVFSVLAVFLRVGLCYQLGMDGAQQTSPLRILHMVGGLGLGGTEKTMQLLAAGMDPEEFSVAVFSFADGPRHAQLKELGIPVHIASEPDVALKRFAPDIVHIHRAGWPDASMLRPLRHHPAKVVETNVFGRFDPSPLGKRIDKHLFVSQFCLQRYCAVNGIEPSGRLGVLYNPVQTEVYSQVHEQLDFNRPVAGRVSRADPGKWSMLALDMIPHVLQQVPDFQYNIIGGTTQARDWVRQNGMEHVVRWYDPVSLDEELAAFHSGLSVFAHANDTGESFGMVIAEAMAAGLPVVTHPAEGLRDNAQLELVEHGKTGLVAQGAEEYGQAVAWLLKHPEQAEAMGRAGREKAGKLYDANVVSKQLQQLYHALLGASPAM